ncbi:PQQ-binding-like beta-propeller repeat protein [Schlesneria sp. DSM 10557]|uniref:outer membrane protein assembly factor BamB family protein n=1 Tax=Schlesneria sp. DSM 10557 TaxID=3044399 RepID=UPI00359F870F
MSGVSISSAAIRQVLFTVLVGLFGTQNSHLICPASVFAQILDPPPPRLAIPPEPVKKPGERRGSSTTFSLDRHQSAVQCADAIELSLERKEYHAVFPLLETLLSEPTTFVPISPYSDVTAAEYVKRVLEQIPPEARTRFEAQRRVAASETWDRAKNAGREEIARFLRDFPESPLAVEAWWQLGLHERDLGHVRRAAAAFRRVAEHPQVSLPLRITALIAATESLTRTSMMNEDAARERRLLAGRLSALDGNFKLEIAGRVITLAEWRMQRDLAASPSKHQSPATSQEVGATAQRWQKHRPVLLPMWRHDLPNAPQTSLEKLVKVLPDPSARPVLITAPLICGSQAIVRTTQEIHSFDIPSGQAQWSIPNTEFLNIGKRIFESTAYRSVAIEWAQRRTQADSLFSRMTTDGLHLFVIQEPDRSSEFRMESDRSRGLPRLGPQYNQLCSYHLKSGELNWEIGGPVSEPRQELEGYCFLSAPLVLDGDLFVIGQRDSDLELLSLSIDTGELNWRLPLGTAARPIDEDLQRSRTACPIVWHEGLLLCSTSSGSIVAVDPAMMSMKWSYRYPAITILAGDMAQMTRRAGRVNLIEPWWETWREPFLAVVQSIPQESGANTLNDSSSPAPAPPPEPVLLFASPETDKLHAIRLPQGQPLWQIDRQDGLAVIGISDQRVIITEDMRVRAHDIGSGELAWATPIEQVSGPAVLNGSLLVIPVQSGGASVLNAIDGTVLNEAGASDVPLGILAETEHGWIAFNRQSVSLLPQLDDIRQSIALELKQDPDNESLRVRAALLDLQAGNVELAREHLVGLTSTPARNLRRQALIAALESNPTATSEVSRTSLARELNELADNSDYRFAAAAAIGMSALAVNDFADTVDACLDGLAANLAHHDQLVKRQTTHVRKDRVLLGLIDEAYRRAPPSDRNELDRLFQSRVNQARNSRDRLALQELWTQWRGLDWSRQLIISDQEKILRKRPLVEQDLRLRDAAGSDDPSIASQAFQRLAEKLERQGLHLEAEAVRRQARTEQQSRELSSSAETSATPPVIEREGTPQDQSIGVAVPWTSSELQTHWPSSKPKIKSRNDRNFGIYAPTIPLHSEPGSLTERLDVSIDRTGDEVYIRGGAFFQTGQDEENERRLNLPKSSSPFRGPGGHMLREGWGIGRIVVLLIGSELFGVSLVDEQGEPNSQFLWANPIDLEIPVGETEEAPSPKGIYSPRQTVRALNGPPLIEIGPVRAGYLCYHQRKRLTAVDTETGRSLWQRYDVPVDAAILGDDQRVFVWHQTGRVDELSAIDGRSLAQRELTASPQDLLLQQGSLAWTARRGATTQVSLHDLRSGECIWTRTDSAEALVAVLDESTLAVVTPEKLLYILDARSAELRFAPLSVKSDAVEEIATSFDSDHWYVAMSRPVPNLEGLKGIQPRESYRTRFVNGPLYAVKRADGQIVWQRDLKNEPFALEVSRSAPVLVQAWKLPPAGINNASEGVFKITDKQTGKILMERRSLDVLPYFLLNPDPQQGMLEIKLTQETITLDYSSDISSDGRDSPKTQETKPLKNQ